MIETDSSMTLEFFRLLFGGVAEGKSGHLQPDQQLAIWSGKTKRTVWCSSLSQAATTCVQLSDGGEDVYAPVALHDPEVALEHAKQKRGGKPNRSRELVRGCAESATVLGGLWSDEDHGEGVHQKKDLPPNPAAIIAYLRKAPTEIRPSLLLNSGGGFYPWWIFKEPWVLGTDEERARAAGLSRRMQRYLHQHLAPEFNHDSTADLARVLRPPGVVNQKYGCLVSVVDLET